MAIAMPDASGLREAFGRFPTGVAIVTAPGGGMTANAVVSLSLDPLLVLVCFARPARTLPLVQDTGRFAVNVLGEGHEALARHFASKTPEREKLATAPHREEAGVPVLSEAIAWVVCALERLEPGGDPEIAIGRVTSLGLGRGEPLLW